MSIVGAPSTAAPAAPVTAVTSAPNVPISTTPTAPPATSATTTPGDWMAGFNDDTKGYVQNKGFKGSGDVVESYRQFEKLMGAPKDRILTLPENMDSPEGRAIWERLGAPASAKDYKLDVPQGGDPKVTEWAANTFHELGVPKGMAEKFVGKWNEQMAVAQAAAIENAKAVFEQAQVSLKKEWGMAFDQNVNIARQAAKVVGIGAEQIDAISAALGHASAMKLFVKLGQSVREDAFVGGHTTGSGKLAPEQARTQIKELRNDREFGSKLNKGDAEAKRQWQSLHEQAYPGEFSF